MDYIEKNIKYWCDKRGFTLKRAAELAGTTETTVHRSIKRGDYKTSLLEGLADVFKIQLTTLVQKRIPEEEINLELELKETTGKYITAQEKIEKLQQDLSDAKDDNIRMNTSYIELQREFHALEMRLGPSKKKEKVT